MALLLISWWRAPHIFDLRLSNSPAIEDGQVGDRPVLLYQWGRTTVHFTTDDLLYPNLWGDSRPAYQAVLFDVVPGREPWFREAHHLTWIVVCARALATTDTDTEPADRARPADSDRMDRLAERFMKKMGDDLGGLRRGEHLPFKIPEEAPYRQQTGIEWFSALAVSLPRVRVDDQALASLPQELDRSVRDATAALVSDGVRGIGLPLIDAADRLDSPFNDESSWLRILGLVNDLAVEGSLDTIVLGAYGLTERTRNSKRNAFVRAWHLHRTGLAAAAGSPTHEIPRLAAIALLAAIVRLAWSARGLTLRRAAAYGLGSFAAAASVVALSAGIANFFAVSSHPGLLVLEGTLAVAAGLFLETILTYDVRKEIAT